MTSGRSRCAFLAVRAAAGFALAAATLGAQSSPRKAAADAAVEPPPWEHQRSDLPPDPRFRFGALKNGLRYVWADHSQPPKRVQLRLYVDVGSLAEQGDELGLAHFLEHMAFNGSKGFKPGTLVPTLQALGVAFGSHVNAHTGFAETVYELDLPDADPARLEPAFRWFRDVIDGLKLDPKEITAEKGVVDAEETVRSGKGRDLFFERLSRLLDGSRYPRRLPIGEKPVRDRFDAKRVRAFWDRWYRPERCTFLVVGDLGGVDPAARIEQAFGTAKARGKAPEPPESDVERLTFERTRFTESYGAGATLHLGRLRPVADAGDDARARLAACELALAGRVLEERMNALAPRAWIEARVTAPARLAPQDALLGYTPGIDGVVVELESTADHWHDAIAMCEREVRRLLERDVAAEEWAGARAALAERFAEPAVPRTPDSDDLVESLLEACRARRVPMDPAADRAAWRAAVAAADPARALAAFRDEWRRGKPLLFAEGELDLGDSAGEMFDDAWRSGAATSLDTKAIVRGDLSGRRKPKEPAKRAATAASTFPYALPDPSAPPAAIRSHALPAVRARRLDLGNGVRVVVKQIDGNAGRFRVEAALGSGLLGVEPERCDEAKLAARVQQQAALAKLQREALETALAEAGAALSFAVTGDRCRFEAHSRGAGGEPGLRRALEAIVASLVDGGDRAAAFAVVAKELPGLLVDTDRPTIGNAYLLFEAALANGDARRLPLARETATKVTAEDVARFLAGQLAGPLDVAIAAELPLDVLERHVTATLATLPPRGAAPEIPDARRDAAPMKCGLDESRGAIETGAKVAWLRIVYPTRDAIGTAAERRLELFGDLVQERMRRDIREALGTTYSPDGGAWGDPALRGRGRVELDVQVEPAKLAATREACLAAMERLAKSGATQAEFERLRAARLGALDALGRDPEFWTGQLLRALDTPQLFDELADLRRWYDGVTLAEVNGLAREALGRPRASILQVRPR